MQILIQILLLINNFYFHSSDVTFLELKFSFEKMLNRLLDENVKKELNSNLDYKLSDRIGRFKMEMHLIDDKVNHLIKFSLHAILKHLAGLIGNLHH